MASVLTVKVTTGHGEDGLPLGVYLRRLAWGLLCDQQARLIGCLSSFSALLVLLCFLSILLLFCLHLAKWRQQTLFQEKVMALALPGSRFMEFSLISLPPGYENSLVTFLSFRLLICEV